MQIPSDREGIEQVFNDLLPIADREATKVYYTCPKRNMYDLDDLRQEARVALWRMVNRYTGKDNVSKRVMGLRISQSVWWYVKKQEHFSGGATWYEKGEEYPYASVCSLDEIEDWVGEDHDPSTRLIVDEIVEVARKLCDEVEYAALTGTCLYGVSLEAMGRERGLTRQRMHQYYTQAVQKVRAYYDQ